MTTVCKHGQLARSCEICELEDEIAELRKQLEERGKAIDNLFQCVGIEQVRAEKAEAENADLRKELGEKETFLIITKDRADRAEKVCGGLEAENAKLHERHNKAIDSMEELSLARQRAEASNKELREHLEHERKQGDKHGQDMIKVMFENAELKAMNDELIKLRKWKGHKPLTIEDFEF